MPVRDAAAALVSQREPPNSNRETPMLAATASTRGLSAVLGAQTAPSDVGEAVASLLNFRVFPSVEPRGWNGSGETSPATTDAAAADSAAESLPNAQHVANRTACAGQDDVSSQARHNATERRRVQKLKAAFTELDEAIRSRPELGLGLELAPTLVAAGGKRARASEPSHLMTLQDSAACMRKLFELVDDLTRRNQQLEREAAERG